MQADIYINTVGTDLVLSNGTVSRSFLDAGGQTLQDECTLYVSQHGKVPVGRIVVTKPGNIPNCQRIIHTVGAKYGEKRSKEVRQCRCMYILESIYIFVYLGNERCYSEVLGEER